MAFAASPVLRVFASRSLSAGDNPYLSHAHPAMMKTWKSYTFMRDQKIKQLSPFEVDIVGPLFRDLAGKLKHKLEDNFLDVAPAFIFYGVMVAGVKNLRASMMLHHRD